MLKRLFPVVIIALLVWGIYSFLTAVYSNAQEMMDDALNGEEVNVEESLIYQIGDRYKDINELSELNNE